MRVSVASVKDFVARGGVNSKDAITDPYTLLKKQGGIAHKLVK